MILEYHGNKPQIAEDAFVAENATLIGSVTVSSGASVWFGAVLRADGNPIEIGEGTSIQDNCTIHGDRKHGVRVGKNVSVGHNALLHGCVVEDDTLIGMSSTILDGAHIGRHCIVGAGALVTGGTQVPDGSLVLGSPARVIKPVSEAQIAMIEDNARFYQELAKEYKR